MNLSPVQIELLQAGLSKILKAENGVVDSEEEFEKNKEISRIQMEQLINVRKSMTKDGKVTIGLDDIMTIGEK